ncbi:hypothetical protein BH24CHL10_BH24CHL10_01570 [soil metagenome]
MLAAVPALLVGCGALPGLPTVFPPECGILQSPGTTVEWSGFGNARELGLIPPDEGDPGQGEIFVGRGRPGGSRTDAPLLRMYCYFPDYADTPGKDGPHTGTVREGWEPP